MMADKLQFSVFVKTVSSLSFDSRIETDGVALQIPGHFNQPVEQLRTAASFLIMGSGHKIINIEKAAPGKILQNPITRHAGHPAQYFDKGDLVAPFLQVQGL